MLYVLIVCGVFLHALLSATSAQAQKLEQIVAEAKKEGEVMLVASASTFGGKKGFAELENLFAKRYGFKAKVSLTGGPSFPQVAARIIAEQKAGAKSSTDHVPRLRRHLCDHGSRKGAGKSELVGNLSLGDQRDGNFSAAVGADLRFVSRHHLQFELDPEK